MKKCDLIFLFRSSSKANLNGNQSLPLEMMVVDFKNKILSNHFNNILTTNEQNNNDSRVNKIKLLLYYFVL